jgi:quinol monooxygenase YgiN
MYGTIARMQLKPGMEARMLEFSRQAEERKIPGAVATYVYRLDQEPNTYMLAVVFKDRASYVANAGSPEQDRDYRKMLEMLDGEPEWHDGEIIDHWQAEKM